MVWPVDDRRFRWTVPERKENEEVSVDITWEGEAVSWGLEPIEGKNYPRRIERHKKPKTSNRWQFHHEWMKFSQIIPKLTILTWRWYSGFVSSCLHFLFLPRVTLDHQQSYSWDDYQQQAVRPYSTISPEWKLLNPEQGSYRINILPTVYYYGNTLRYCLLYESATSSITQAKFHSTAATAVHRYFKDCPESGTTTRKAFHK